MNGAPSSRPASRRRGDRGQMLVIFAGGIVLLLGVAALVALAGLVVAALAFVPALGYAEAALAPLAALRLRGRAGRRYAGLRILAKD